jgi:hypothetical protein
VKGDLPPTTPAYEAIGHWLRHPMLTVRARALAKADPRLGLYDSLAAARGEIRRERRQAAIAKVLHRKIRAAVDPRTADIAIAVYDLDEIAARLADRADYDGLTSLIAADLAPERLAPDGLSVPRKRPRERSIDKADDTRRAVAAPRRAASAAVEEVAGALASAVPQRTEPVGNGTLVTSSVPARPSARATLPPALRQHVERQLGNGRSPARRSPDTVASFSDDQVHEPGLNDVSLRRRVHAALDASVLPDDQRDDAELIGLVYDDLNLNDAERLSAATYVRSWRMENELGERVRAH